MSMPALDDATFDELYKWLDSVPFSKPRKNIARDFSDGVLVAELISYFVPNIIDMHNYMEANASILKRYNWETLNRKVFPRLNLHMTSQQIVHLIAMKPGAAEFFLLGLRPKIDLAVCQRERNWRMRSTSATRQGSVQNLTGDDELSPASNNAQCANTLNVLNGFGAVSEPQSPSSPFKTNTIPRNSRKISSSSSANSSPRRVNPQQQQQLVRRPSAPRGSLSYGAEDDVLTRLLDEAKQTILKKQETIQVMQARIDHLEKLVELKQERISQLNRHLEHLTHTNIQNTKALNEQNHTSN